MKKYHEKKLILFFLAFVFAGLSISSCRKYSKITEANVTVISKETQVPIPNAEVVLMDAMETSYGGPTNFVILDRQFTDASGKCSFTYKYDSKRSYILGARAEGYIGEDGMNGAYNAHLHENVTNTEVIPLQSEGYIRINVKNTSPNDIHDGLEIHGIDSKSYGFSGMNVDTSIIEKGIGGTTPRVVWYRYKNSKSTQYWKYFYITGHDTLVYDLNY